MKTSTSIRSLIKNQIIQPTMNYTFMENTIALTCLKKITFKENLFCIRKGYQKI